MRSPGADTRVKPYRIGDLVALGLWQCPPWIIIGDFIYQWQIENANPTLAWIGLFAAAFTIARLLCRLIQYHILRAMPIALD